MTIKERVKRVEKQNRRLKWAMAVLCVVEVVVIGGIYLLHRGDVKPPVDATPPAATPSVSVPEPSSDVLPKEFTNSIGMQFVHINAGEFMMGSPADEQDRRDNENQHPVRITKPFLLGVHEVTQAQWRSVMSTDRNQFKGDDLPVEHVSWDDATAFCQKLSQQEGKKYRLPTEAEWEYACRAGTTTPFATGQTIGTDQANYNGGYTYGSGQRGVHRRKTTAVGSFQPNQWGLCDMHGNVWEWCHDNYERAEGARVLRGGSWNDIPWECRSANRGWRTPDGRFGVIGFRVALDLSD